MNKPELLIPAGSLENLYIAVAYGADAVYIGGEAFGLRAKAKNFDQQKMIQGIAYAHGHGVKVYVTANIIAHNEDISQARAYFEELLEIQPDGVIIADPGMLMIAKEVMPDMEFHLSTQANNTNYATMQFWHQQGVKRVVVARELSLEEITFAKKKVPKTLDFEAFVHGAMCISYSGRCLLSNYMSGRDANKGACTHPCRWTYHLVEETRPGEYMPVYENERGTYIYNSKDLCMISHIDKLIASGIDSFKIEGRMKTALYVATVTKTWREAIDDYFSDPDIYASKLAYYEEEVRKCTHRQFTTGFYFDKPDGDEQIYTSNTYTRSYTFVGKGIDYDPVKGMAHIQQRNKFVVGDTLEVLKTNGKNIEFTVDKMYNIEGEIVREAPHPKQDIWIEVDFEILPNEIIRRPADQGDVI
ncbi:MAG: peptidase U32 [Firmicutes bacterium HGW-Firmicutes-2]|jgi:putative protease|nr:MAG: peptidase U32 [Firmicutes bacterium HGW-Firmicutes-2]